MRRSGRRRTQPPSRCLEAAVTELTPTRSPSPVRRRPWVAVVMSLLLPGLGHLYAGAPRRALAFWMLSLAASTGAVAIAAVLQSRLVLLWAALAPVLIFAPIAWSAARTVRAAGVDFLPRGYNRSYVYVAAWLGVAFVVQPLHLRLLKKFLLEAYQMPSTSMEPTILQGDYFFVRPLHRAPKRGEIIVYRRRSASWIKRVVGLPNDTVEMHGGAMRVNAEPLGESYTQRVDAGHDVYDPEFNWQKDYLVGGPALARGYHPTRDNWGPLVVPPGNYFVLGANRHLLLARPSDRSDTVESSRYSCQPFRVTPTCLTQVPRRLRPWKGYST